jgi:hypothetical protein
MTTQVIAGMTVTNLDESVSAMRPERTRLGNRTESMLLHYTSESSIERKAHCKCRYKIGDGRNEQPHFLRRSELYCLCLLSQNVRDVGRGCVEVRHVHTQCTMEQPLAQSPRDSLPNHCPTHRPAPRDHKVTDCDRHETGNESSELVGWRWKIVDDSSKDNTNQRKWDTGSHGKQDAQYENRP